MKFILCIIMLFCNNCTKTITINTNTASGLKYIEPKKCEIKKINKKKYNTEIVGNKLVIDDKNLGILLKNISEYKLSIKEFEICCNTNEEYYKNIIEEIIK